MLFKIAAKEIFSDETAAAKLKIFLNKEKKNSGLQIREFSENPFFVTVAIASSKKHHLRIALNLFAAETGICWTLSSL